MTASPSPRAETLPTGIGLPVTSEISSPATLATLALEVLQVMVLSAALSGLMVGIRFSVEPIVISASFRSSTMEETTTTGSAPAWVTFTVLLKPTAATVTFALLGVVSVLSFAVTVIVAGPAEPEAGLTESQSPVIFSMDTLQSTVQAKESETVWTPPSLDAENEIPLLNISRLSASGMVISAGISTSSQAANAISDAANSNKRRFITVLLDIRYLQR